MTITRAAHLLGIEAACGRSRNQHLAIREIAAFGEISSISRCFMPAALFRSAAEILRAAGTADETDRTPVLSFRCSVMPAVEQAERTFSTALTRINIEDLAQSAAALPTQEPDRADSILTEPDSVRESRARDRRTALMVIERLLKEQYNAPATPVPPHLAACSRSAPAADAALVGILVAWSC